MTKSGWLAVLFVVIGSTAAASASQQAVSGSNLAPADSDTITRLAMVYCDIKHWHSNKCMGHVLFHCDNWENHSCKVTSKCQMYYPQKNCAG